MNPFLSGDNPSLEGWESRANCKGKPVELFEYQEKNSPLARDMSFAERLIFNDSNFKQAEEICIECPVFFECGATATEEDRTWTVRQGEMPGRFQAEAEAAQGRPAKGAPRVCQRGHYQPNGGTCNRCRYDSNNKRRKERRAQAAREAEHGVE
jgi:hypothetical protein